jgi:hypothetical protein
MGKVGLGIVIFLRQAGSIAAGRGDLIDGGVFISALAFFISFSLCPLLHFTVFKSI